MLDSVFNSQKNVLDPMERISEVPFWIDHGSHRDLFF